MTSLKRRWTDEDQRRAEELRGEGWSLAAIGEALGWSHSTVRMRLDPAALEKANAEEAVRREKRRDARRRSFPGGPPPWNDANQKDAERLRAAGCSLEAIGRGMGWSAEAIRCHLDPAQREKHRERGARRRQDTHRARQARFPSGRGHWTRGDQADAEALRANGWTYEAIAVELGCHISTVWTNLAPGGVERRRERNAAYERENAGKIRERRARHRQRTPEKYRERNARWERNNPEKVREKRARYRRNNPEKARERTRRRRALRSAGRRQSLFPLTLAQKHERFALFGNACAYCGTKGGLSVDHVLALHNGGHDDWQNVIPACLPHNCSKQHRPVEAWFRSQPFFTEVRWAKIRKHCPNSSRGQLVLGWDPEYSNGPEP
jgi:5-methylcytosine-specific restriction endonuclease McrA